MPEMTFGVKVGMSGFVLALVGLLFVYHILFTPRPRDVDAAEVRDAEAPGTRLGAAESRAGRSV
jgi:hypothetical protein